MSEAQNPDTPDTADKPGPAAANMQARSNEFGPQIARLTKQFSVDVLEEEGQDPSGQAVSAIVQYSGMSWPLGYRSVAANARFVVPPDYEESGKGIVTVEYRSVFTDPEADDPKPELLEELRAEVDIDAEQGGILNIERSPVSDLATRLVEADVRPLELDSRAKDDRLYVQLQRLERYRGSPEISFQ